MGKAVICCCLLVYFSLFHLPIARMNHSVNLLHRHYLGICPFLSFVRSDRYCIAILVDASKCVEDFESFEINKTIAFLHIYVDLPCNATNGIKV